MIFTPKTTWVIDTAFKLVYSVLFELLLFCLWQCLILFSRHKIQLFIFTLVCFSVAPHSFSSILLFFNTLPVIPLTTLHSFDLYRLSHTNVFFEIIISDLSVPPRCKPTLSKTTHAHFQSAIDICVSEITGLTESGDKVVRFDTLWENFCFFISHTNFSSDISLFSSWFSSCLDTMYTSTDICSDSTLSWTKTFYTVYKICWRCAVVYHTAVVTRYVREFFLFFSWAFAVGNV